MITKFGSLFAGHIDLDNIGLDGTPVNDRWLPDDRLAGVFDKTEAIVLKMEEMGYDTFWSAEHHFQREGYECIPNLLLLYVHLAHLTRKPEVRLRIQHQPDVASAPPGGRLCHCRHPHGRPGRLRRGGAAITPARLIPLAFPAP